MTATISPRRTEKSTLLSAWTWSEPVAYVLTTWRAVMMSFGLSPAEAAVSLRPLRNMTCGSLAAVHCNSGEVRFPGRSPWG